MFYGAFHTALSHQLANDGEKTFREFQKNIMPFDVSNQMLRYYRFSKTPPLELEEKALFLELIIHDRVQEKLLPAEERNKQVDAHVWMELRRKILDAMTVEDMRRYYELRKSATPEERFNYVNSFLEKNK